MIYVSGDAHLSQAYPVILELLGVLMNFPLEAARWHVLAQVLLPASVNLIRCFWKETLGLGSKFMVHMYLLPLLIPMVGITSQL